jgi:hypothetical protein
VLLFAQPWRIPAPIIEQPCCLSVSWSGLVDDHNPLLAQKPQLKSLQKQIIRQNRKTNACSFKI